jgi:hypothetical protein
MGDALQPAAGRLTLERCSFVPPPGYDDVTNYAYRGPDEVPRLKVHYVPDLDAVGGLDAALKDYQAQVVKFLLAQVESASPAPTPRGDLTTETLVFTFPGTGANDPCDRYREWCGFGRFPKGAGFQVEYVTSAEDAAGEGVFEKVLSSVRLVGEATPGGKAAPGLVRRQAGAVTLAMPVELQPPTSFHFVREEKGSKARLTVAIAGSAADAHALIEEHLKGLGIVSEPAAPLAALAQAPATLARAVWKAHRHSSKGDVTRTVCHQVKPIKDSHVIVLGEATDDWHDRLLGDFDRLIDSTSEGWR